MKPASPPSGKRRAFPEPEIAGQGAGTDIAPGYLTIDTTCTPLSVRIRT